MSGYELLVEKIRDSGVKKGYLAEKCGITRYGFYKKIKKPESFSYAQVSILCNELKISAKEKDNIFFAHKDEK